MLSERVKARVGRGVVSLARAAEQRGDRREERARMERRIADSFVAAFTSLKATGFAKTAAFDSVSDVVTVRLAGDKVVSLELGAPFGSGRYARIASKPERVVVLPTSAVQLLSTARAVLLPKKDQRER